MVGRRRGPLLRSVVIGLTLLVCPRILAASAHASETVTYRDVLRRYALADEGQALRRLSELETGPGLSRPQLERMRTERLGLLEGLSPLEPDLLLPVFALHEASYRPYLEEELPEAALHARTTLVLLCELYAERALTEEQQARAADLFAILGAHFQESSSDRSALQLFRRALELDPRNESALLGAGAALERQGRYYDALRYLQRLSENHPRNLEGRLRLAINLRRAGRGPEAMPLVEQLLRTDAPSWIQSLAYRSLADWLLEADNLDRAASLLEEGTERLPNDPTLAIAMAYVREHRRPSETASGLDASLRAIAVSDSSSPRLRYAIEPVEVFDRSIGRLRLRANANREGLALALDQPPTAEPQD